MDEREVRICWLTPENEGDLRLPRYETPGAAGMDVEAAIVKELIILPG